MSVRLRWKTFLALALLGVLSIAAILLVGFVALFWRFTRELPAMEVLVTDIRTPVPTTIWSQDGVLLGQLRVENRQPILLSDMPSHMKNATIAIEDHRFYQHPGIDLKGTARAVWANVVSRDATGQGGSTLTQQLVRNIKQFGLTKEKRFERKLREAFTAIRIEQLYSKDEILQLYLNNVYYGRGAYGVEAAAKAFFGKPAAKLTISEAALIAGMAQRPSDFSRNDQRRRAMDRRNEVLAKMRDYAYISEQEYHVAKADTPHFVKRTLQNNFDFKAPYFVTHVIKLLTKKYGYDYLSSGLKIETTLNWKMQQDAEATVKQGLERASEIGANQAALICLDNKTGYIRAMVGGRDFQKDQFNTVTQGRRQPGSTFKVFDYATAFDSDAASLYTTFRDEPIAYPSDPTKVVKNYSGGYSHSSVSCLTAIQFSKNTIAVAVAQKVGISKVIATAKKMGIQTPLAPYLPTALGASAVRPIDLASAYSVFPMQGRRCLPMSVARVSDPNGDIILEALPQITEPLLKSSTVEQMDKALEAVVTGGTGTRARGYSGTGVVEGARGKTGTTNDNRDAWFAGYTPELTTVIWVAKVVKSGKKVTYAVMPGATGGHLCAPMWHDFMLKAVPEQRKTQAAIAGITVSQAQVEQKSAEDPDKEKRSRRRIKKKETETPEVSPVEEDDDAPRAMTPRSFGQTGEPNEEDNGEGADRPNTEPSDTSPPESGATPVTPAPSPTRRGAGGMALAPARTARPSSGGALTTVSVCVDTGKLASAYCPETKTVRMSRDQKQNLSACTQHRHEDE